MGWTTNARIFDGTGRSSTQQERRTRPAGWPISPPGSVYDALPAVHACQPSASQLLRPLYDRVPVILAPKTYRPWLGENNASPPELLALLKPYPPDAMRAYPVSTVVNSPKNDRPECIEPAA